MEQVLSLIGQALSLALNFVGIWLQALWDGGKFMILQLGWWSAIPITIVVVLVVFKLTPLGWITDKALGFVVGHSWYYFKRLMANSFASWVFIGSMAFEPLRRFSRWHDTVAYITAEYQQAFYLLALMVAQSIVCFLAARRQWRLVTDIGTPVDTLKFESRTSGVMAVILTGVVCWLVPLHMVPWGLWVPWFFTVYNAWEIWDRTVNTAALKPLQQMQVQERP